MDLVIVVGLVLIVGLLLFWLGSKRQQAPAKGKPRAAMEALDTVAAWPPQATRILTVAERKAYTSLKAGLPDHIVLAQVPLSRFMKVPTRNSYSEWLRRVGLMSADLVVCDANSHVVAVIDIRDEGKENERARQRHSRMDRVLEAAGIPVHVWHESTIPGATAARDLVLSRIKVIPEAQRPAGAQAQPTAHGHETHHPVEPDLLLDAEHHEEVHEHRDPPPSTWFDNLDSAAVPLNPGPPQRSAANPNQTPASSPLSVRL